MKYIYLDKFNTMLRTLSINTKEFFKIALKELSIDDERKQYLQKIARFIAKEIDRKSFVNLNYICTHNSRRSQIAQVWSAYSAHKFKMEAVQSFSGGNAVTAFYRNTVKTLQEAGFYFQE